jgi:hypothetical protein
MGWSVDFVVLVAERPALEQLRIAEASTARWLLVDREGGRWRYVFSKREIAQHSYLKWLRNTASDLSLLSLTDALNLHETDSSQQVPDAALAAQVTVQGQPGSATRFVEVDASGSVLRVGGPDVRRTRRVRALPPDRDGARTTASREPSMIHYYVREPLGNRGGFHEEVADGPPLPAVVGVVAEPSMGLSSSLPDADEGTRPVRFPSLDAEGTIAADQPITIVVDLLREASEHTAGGPLNTNEQPADWTSLALTVTLLSPAVDFDGTASGTVVIHRNAASTPARIPGIIRADLAPDSEIDITAQFWAGTRFSGFAMRKFRLSAIVPAATDTSTTPPSAPSLPRRVQAGPVTTGAVQVETSAQAPDLTVYITVADATAPGVLHWRMITAPFDTRPPKLDGTVVLGKDPSSEAAAMFKQFATLERGKHRRMIESFGQVLWQRAPEEFQLVYWALHDHLKRRLTIQFISDDPHLPWELMAPFRNGDRHAPLAVEHCVGRWINRYAGLMRNALSAGRIVAIAPKYKSANLRLSGAELTAAKVVEKFTADRVEGKYNPILSLLEDPVNPPVALLFFTGHGAFSTDTAAASLIKLEDGNISAQEVANLSVTLGERHGTVVFFNACEVGATGSVLGATGGWADAFLSRHFRAFIAPLWAVDEEDASMVTCELMDMIVTQRMNLGCALRQIRETHGDVSPTFYSYLLYGDVTASLPALATASTIAEQVP